MNYSANAIKINEHVNNRDHYSLRIRFRLKTFSNGIFSYDSIIKSKIRKYQNLITSHAMISIAKNNYKEMLCKPVTK